LSICGSIVEAVEEAAQRDAQRELHDLRLVKCRRNASNIRSGMRCALLVTAIV
jgi:hypothetical protein